MRGEEASVPADLLAASSFRGYVRDLAALNRHAMQAGGLPLSSVDLARQHLDGRAGRELRAAVDIHQLREMGAFFTGESLAASAVEAALEMGDLGVTMDPACGCGDLLLAAAWRLPVERDLGRTLRSWGRMLRGCDVVPEFVAATRERLVLLAMVRGARASAEPLDLNALLPDIVVADGRRSDLLRGATTVLLNPPYGRVQAPAGCSFARGATTDAALWMADVLRRVAMGTQIVAILPDVLRSGSRYQAFRGHVAQHADVTGIVSKGQFDALTDVDVFLLSLRRSTGALGWPTAAHPSRTLQDECSVSVGPVVDRRDPHLGAWAPYITTRDLPQEGSYRPVRHRRYRGRLFAPPFVLLRRTSRPSSSAPRLRPVVVEGDRPVAVENHLLVLKPQQATPQSCWDLAAALGDPAVTEWLDRRIRCRHLTVAALRELPLAWPPAPGLTP